MTHKQINQSPKIAQSTAPRQPKFTREQVRRRQRTVATIAGLGLLAGAAVGVEKVVDQPVPMVNASVTFSQGGSYSQAAEKLSTQFEEGNIDPRYLMGELQAAHDAEMTAKGSSNMTLRTGQTVVIQIPKTPEIEAAMAAQKTDPDFGQGDLSSVSFSEIVSPANQ